MPSCSPGFCPHVHKYAEAITLCARQNHEPIPPNVRNLLNSCMCHATLYCPDLQKYTEAITLSPGWSVLYINRAMCARKREEWGRVAEDAARALELEKDLMKVGHKCSNKLFDVYYFDKIMKWSWRRTS